MDRLYAASHRNPYSYLFLLLFLSAFPAFGQQFTVTEQLTNVKSFQNIDGSVAVAFRVRYNTTEGAPSTLTNVIPTLVVPDCAAFNSEIVFNATYLGRGFPTYTFGPVPSWGNNTTQDLVFNIHMYNNNTFCPATNETPINLDEICRTFELNFTYTNQATPVVAVAENNALLFQNPVTDGFKIVQVISDSDGRPLPQGRCGLYTVNSVQIPISRYTLDRDIVLDPENRVLFGVDWNLNTNSGPVVFNYKIGIGDMQYPVGNLLYNMWQHFLIPSDAAPLYHSENPQTILDQEGNPLTLGLLGGNGGYNQADCETETFNWVDLSGVSVSGMPIRERVLTATLPLTYNITRGQSFLNFRRAMLVIAAENRCEFGNAFGLGPSETQFKFASVANLGDGRVTVALDVPTAWKNSATPTQLDSDYTVRWYYTNERTLAPAVLADTSGDTDRRLDATLSIPGDPGSFGYQARITHNASGSVVTVDVPADSFQYAAFNRPTIANGESEPDDYLDAGETLLMPFSVKNDADEAVSLEVIFGIVDNGHELLFDGSFGTGGTQTDPTQHLIYSGALAAGQTLAGDLDAMLAGTSFICEPITFFVETRYLLNGVLYSNYRTFNNEVNCLLDNSVFRADNSYVSRELFGSPDPCSTSNCENFECSDPVTCLPPAGIGWQFQGGRWIGVSRDKGIFHTLTSPALPIVPTGASISLTHEASFLLITAGGILEYRTRVDEDSDWTLWSDLILALEEEYDRTYYNTRVFPPLDSNLDQIIAGRHVFMRQSATQQISHVLPDEVLAGGEIQFRFLFQQNDPGDVGVWDIEEFTYATIAAADNEFNATVPPNFNIGPCTPDLSFEVSSNHGLTFDWFNNFQSLVNNTPAAQTIEPRWQNVSKQESGSAYVVVTADNGLEPTTRIFELNVILNGAVPPFEVVRDAWLDEVDTPGDGNDIVADGEINVLDLVLQVTSSDCDN